LKPPPDPFPPKPLTTQLYLIFGNCTPENARKCLRHPQLAEYLTKNYLPCFFGFIWLKSGGRMNLTREERETIIRCSDADDGWIISTASPKYIRKFTKLGYQEDSAGLSLNGYKDFAVPRNLVSFRRPRK
jgi:hypothetical protein